MSDYQHKQDIMTPGVWCKLLYTGKSCSDNCDWRQHIHFYVSNDQVKPKNTATKIWKRIQ